MAQIQFVQAQKFSLSGSGTSIGDITITLQSMVGIDGSNIVTADLGTTAFGTLEPGNGTQEEAISFTGITQNANGTATLTGVSTVLFKSPYTATSGLAKTHAGASTFVLSNDAAFYANILNYVNTALVSGAVPATGTQIGITKLTQDPAVAATPIAVGANTTLSGTAINSSTNKVVDQLSTSYASVASGVPIATSTGKINFGYIPASGAVIDVYTTTGTATWTKRNGISYVMVVVQAGGGGSGGVAGSDGSSGGAGGGGGYAFKIIPATTLSSSEVVTVGFGGAGGAAGANSGSAGGNSSFGTIPYVVASGGALGDNNNTPGAGGAASGGDVNISGQTSFANGNSGSGATRLMYLSSGGGSQLGRGGGSKFFGSANAAPGISGTNYGGGASGAGNANSGSTAAGGSGGQGIVQVINYFY